MTTRFFRESTAIKNFRVLFGNLEISDIAIILCNLFSSSRF
jgi:hypothetical protein